VSLQGWLFIAFSVTVFVTLSVPVVATTYRRVRPKPDAAYEDSAHT
jgi:hypothetical protein